MKIKKSFLYIFAVIYCIIYFIGYQLLSYKLELELRDNTRTLPEANGFAKTLSACATGFLSFHYEHETDLHKYDNVYCGSLSFDESEVEKYSNPSFNFEDIEMSLLSDYGRPESDGSNGYYYIMVRDNRVIQLYWSPSKEILLYENYLTDLINSGNSLNSVYIGGDIVGGYPTEVTKFGEKCSWRNTPIIRRIRLKKIMFCIFYSIPLLCICIVIKYRVKLK